MIVMFPPNRIRINNLPEPLLIPMELHDIALQINVPKGVIIQGDSGWLSEAIQNILKNCMESAGDNGKIEIICEDNPLFTEVSIHDSGAGFEKEDLPCLFDRFYCGRNASATEYGIGLALCKMIITRQGGRITAKNHPQGGALFTIRFPK
jgi:K+-sensing histidine kinase KdpD